ncbi:MAG: ArsA family ATPase [Desulfobacter sp.]|nr:MAG: ArsA family ATPase [Desulfobacter sp.]
MNLNPKKKDSKKTGPKTLFFLGKGGTGKSTASALTALELAAKGSKVLLASFDDAHNLSDIFQAEFSHRPARVADNLEVLQVDRDREIKRYLDQTTKKVKQSYNYLTAFNLHNYFDVLKFSPGMEAHALATAFTDLKKKHRGLDYLIIDMPPTALSMHFFNLPALSLLWIEQLEKLRNEINERKEIISRIKVGNKEIQRDKVLARIKALKTDHLDLKAFFGDPERALFIAVHNGEPLSRAETQRIISQLEAMGIGITGLILNHRSPSRPRGELPAEMAAVNSMELPYSADPLIGMDTLNHYAKKEKINLAPLLS